MSEIKIVEKIVAPQASWTQLIINCEDENVECCAYKVIFDRAYPYFWIWSPFGGRASNGLAINYADLERSATFEEDTNAFLEFDLHADGIIPFIGNMAFCIALGSRKSFYILSNMSHLVTPYGGSCSFYISAQDDPICPFVMANPWNT